DVLVAESLEKALELWEQQPDFTYVTLEGDLLTREGILVGGSWGSYRGVLEIRRETEELRESITQSTERLENVERRLTKLSREIEATEAELARVDEALDRESKKVVDHEKDFERIEEAIRRCRQNLDVIQLERNRLTDDRAALERAV